MGSWWEETVRYKVECMVAWNEDKEAHQSRHQFNAAYSPSSIKISAVIHLALASPNVISMGTLNDARRPDSPKPAIIMNTQANVNLHP